MATVSRSSTHISRNASASVSRGRRARVWLELSEVGGLSRSVLRLQERLLVRLTNVTGVEPLGIRPGFAEHITLLRRHVVRVDIMVTQPRSPILARPLVRMKRLSWPTLCLSALLEHYSSMPTPVAWPQQQRGLIMQGGAQQWNGGGVGGGTHNLGDGGGVGGGQPPWSGGGMDECEPCLVRGGVKVEGGEPRLPDAECEGAYRWTAFLHYRKSSAVQQ